MLKSVNSSQPDPLQYIGKLVESCSEELDNLI